MADVRLDRQDGLGSEYWFVVKADNVDLANALRRVLAAHPGYHVIADRRSGHRSVSHAERRSARVWTGDTLSIAEYVRVPDHPRDTGSTH